MEIVKQTEFGRWFHLFLLFDMRAGSYAKNEGGARGALGVIRNE